MGPCVGKPEGIPKDFLCMMLLTHTSFVFMLVVLRFVIFFVFEWGLLQYMRETKGGGRQGIEKRSTINNFIVTCEEEMGMFLFSVS